MAGGGRWGAQYTVNPQSGKIIASKMAEYMQLSLGPRIINNARRLVPIGVSRAATRNTPAHRAGALKRAIDFEVKLQGEGAVLTVGIDAGNGENVDYGGYVEQGTSKMAAQPFLRPAVYQARGTVKA